MHQHSGNLAMDHPAEVAPLPGDRNDPAEVVGYELELIMGLLLRPSIAVAEEAQA